MTTPKEKAASPCQGEAALQTNLNSKITRPDALTQWFALAANAKSQQIKHNTKRAWKRGRK